MTAQLQSIPNGDCLTIKVNGRFDASARKAFTDCYEGSSAVVVRFVVDMDAASYIDSAALGMLLMLRDHAGGDRACIEIVNCNSDVRKIFTIANFEQLFQIH